MHPQGPEQMSFSVLAAHQKLWDLYTMYYYSTIKQEISSFVDSTDEPGEYYAKWNKPLIERHMPYHSTYMCNLMNKIN